MFRTDPISAAHSREQTYRWIGRDVTADAFATAADRHALQLGVYGIDGDLCDCDGYWHHAGCSDCRHPRALYPATVVLTTCTTMCNHCGELYDHRTGVGHAVGCDWVPVSHVVSPAAELEGLRS